MKRASVPAASRKERRWHPVPKLPPMSPDFQRHYQLALHRYGQMYKTARIRRYNVSKTRTRFIWLLRRWAKDFRERGPRPEIVRHLAYCSAHIAVIDSRN
jgi:hypothetical protein